MRDGTSEYAGMKGSHRASTEGVSKGEQDKRQHPAGRIGTREDIAEMVLYLCGDTAGFITGENITVDGGMSKLMVYHADHGWKLS